MNYFVKKQKKWGKRSGKTRKKQNTGAWIRLDTPLLGSKLDVEDQAA